jgi:hypothetical protein
MVGFALAPGQKAHQVEQSNPPLTAKLLDSTVKDSYSHRTLDIDTASDKQKHQDQEAFARMQDDKTKAEQDDQLRRDQEVAHPDESAPEEEEKSEEEQNSDEDLDGENVEYEVYYDQEQIKSTFQEQCKDVFKELNDERIEVFNSNKGLKDLQAQNLFNIAQWAPKDAEAEGAGRENRKKGKRTTFDADSDIEAELSKIREEQRLKREKEEKIKLNNEKHSAHKYQENQLENDIMQLLKKSEIVKHKSKI